MPYGKIIMDSGREVLFEIEGPISGEISKDGFASNLEKRFEDIVSVIKDTAEGAHNGMKQIKETARPDEYQIKFGLKINANAGVFLAKAGSEASFEVTLSWRGR